MYLELKIGMTEEQAVKALQYFHNGLDIRTERFKSDGKFRVSIKFGTVEPPNVAVSGDITKFHGVTLLMPTVASAEKPNYKVSKVDVAFFVPFDIV